MRKIICILGVLFCTVFFFVSCASVPEAPDAFQTVPPAPTQTIAPTVVFSTFDINKKYYSDLGNFVELDLKLPILAGTYAGIPAINQFFADKENCFYNELPLDALRDLEAAAPDRKIEGQKDNFYRQAHYCLEAGFGGIISVSATLNGGAGGVGWAGIEGDTFDLNTGKKLSLSDIFEADEDRYMNTIYDFVSKKVADDINENLQKGYGSPYSFDDAYSGDGYESIRQFDPNDFYLTETALVVFYQKYALSYGAAGPQVFEIPYESILNMLKIRR